MKNSLIVLSIIFVFILSSQVTFADNDNYREIYRNLELPNFSYLHNVDPGQFYDNQSASYSVYPLFRLCSPIYFKSITITPGYYDLTPREHEGKDYLLFKTNGLVKYIVPVYKKEIVPLGFYNAHLPKPKRSITQKIGDKLYNFVGNHFKKAMRKPCAKTYLEVNDMDDYFIVLVVYYNDFRYYTVFRTIK